MLDLKYGYMASSMVTNTLCLRIYGVANSMTLYTLCHRVYGVANSRASLILWRRKPYGIEHSMA